ncbi:MAG: YceI family protein [Pseudomonadales bacterium]
MNKVLVAGWNPLARSFHWFTLVLVVAAATLGFLAEERSIGPAKLELFATHKSLGLSVLVLVAVRLLWRLLSTPAAPIGGLSRASQRAAGAGHAALYLVLLTLPLSGWWLTSVANFPFHWFGLFEVPMLVPASEADKDIAKEAHETLFWVLVLLVAGHVLMTIRHRRKGIAVAERMLPQRPAAPWFFALLLSLSGVIVFWALASADALGGANAAIDQRKAELRKPGREIAAQAPLQKADTEAIQASAKTFEEGQISASLPAQATETSAAQATKKSAAQATGWSAVAQDSKLEFIGKYLGTEFTGGFRRFSVDMEFDPANPAAGRIDVSVDVSSATTGSGDMDEMLPDPDWFYFGQYPTARFTSTRLQRAGQGYRAEGTLTLKGHSKPVAISFAWQADAGDRARMQVSATLNRRDFAIGSGEWSNDDSIGFEVDVRAGLLLEKPASMTGSAN